MSSASPDVWAKTAAAPINKVSKKITPMIIAGHLCLILMLFSPRSKLTKNAVNSIRTIKEYKKDVQKLLGFDLESV
jgi:hypothetical protein